VRRFFFEKRASRLFDKAERCAIVNTIFGGERLVSTGNHQTFIRQKHSLFLLTCPQDLRHGMKLCGESRNAPGKTRTRTARSRAGDYAFYSRRRRSREPRRKGQRMFRCGSRPPATFSQFGKRFRVFYAFRTDISPRLLKKDNGMGLAHTG
jgi:hypothetical protein